MHSMYYYHYCLRISVCSCCHCDTGIADSFNMVLDGEEVMDLPYFGERAREMNANIPQARPGGKDIFVAPVSVPRTPSRNYFLFQQPLDTRDLNIYDKAQCKAAYESVRGQVEDGISTLLQFREYDSFKDFLPRTLYEFANGGKRQAPTAPLNLKCLKPKPFLKPISSRAQKQLQGQPHETPRH